MTTLVDVAIAKFGPEFVKLAVGHWQGTAYAHPLTCGVDSTHRSLVPSIHQGAVVLGCPDCKYLQQRIPDTVVMFFLNSCREWADHLNTITDHG